MKSGLLVPLVLLGLGVQTQFAQAGDARCLRFSELGMTLERNATDGDTEVVIFAQGQDDGLKRLLVTAPDGRAVAKARANRRGVGLREFVFESAEPPDLGAVLETFPEGTYRFSGQTVKGRCIEGSARLSHRIAPATELLTPLDEQVISIWQVVLAWKPVPAAQRYVVELNNESTGAEWTFEVFPPTTSIPIPAHFLQRDAEYQFGVGVKTANGNVTFVERTFFTAP